MNIYSIKDTKVGFTSVFTAPNNFVAIRMFADTAKDGQSLIAMHPEDFELYNLGKLNDESGQIEPEVTYLERAQSFMKGKENGN